MNYEEKYKQALEAVDEILNSGLDSIPMSRLKLRLQPFFIELKESEDEKIRKALIRLIESATEGKYGISEFKVDGFCRDKLLTWLEKQKTSEEALQYLKENHSPSEMSDFQAAMNIAVAKSYDKGYNDALEKQGEKKPAWSEEDEETLNRIRTIVRNDNSSRVEDILWLKSLKDRYTWKPSKEQVDVFEFMIRSWAESGTLSPYGNVYNSIMSLLNDLKKL